MDARERGDGDCPDTSTLRRDRRHLYARAGGYKSKIKGLAWVVPSESREGRMWFSPPLGLQMAVFTSSFFLHAQNLKGHQ